MATVEQLCAHPRSGSPSRRYWKRYLGKLRRRVGKRLLDDAPKRNSYRGWSD